MRWRWLSSRAERGPSRADAAVEQSRRQLDEAKQERRHWEDFTERLRQIRERNHLADAVERALREGR